MKPIRALATTFILTLLTVGIAGCTTESHEQSKLAAQAKVSRAAAEQAAFTKVPGGTIREGELENEKGALIWSFDIVAPGSKDITEVAVDAISGQVLSVEKETAETEAKEKAKDGRK